MEWRVENYKGQPNKQLIALMDYKGYSLRTLATATNISSKNLWLIINGRCFPRIDTLLMICRVLECSVDYLYPINYNIS